MWYSVDIRMSLINEGNKVKLKEKKKKSIFHDFMNTSNTLHNLSLFILYVWFGYVISSE